MSPCEIYLDKLSRIAEIKTYLERHRVRVQAELGGELVAITQVAREDRLSEAMMRKRNPTFLDWLELDGNGATVFHGAPSPSLMAFMPKGSLGLLPNQILLFDLDLVPLTGRFDSLEQNPWALNIVGMNVVGPGRFNATFHYADPPTREQSGDWEQKAQDLEREGRPYDLFLAKLYRTRLETMRQVPQELHWLLAAPFPVVYGFALRKDALLWLPSRSSPHTIVASNLSPQELRLVLVPAAQVAKVQKIFTKLPVQVLAIEDMQPYYQKSFATSYSVVNQYHREIREFSDEQFDQLLAR